MNVIVLKIGYKMDYFDFEELVADMLDISDEQINNEEDCLERMFYERYNLEMEHVYEFVKTLIYHTPIVEAGITRNKYHAFVSKKLPIMLMKVEAKLGEKSKCQN